MTPAKKKRLYHNLGDALVMVFALAGVMLADPWQQYRVGLTPQFVAPENLLALIFSILGGLGAVYGLQEFNGKEVDRDRKHQKIVKRCITAFVLGAGARVAVG